MTIPFAVFISYRNHQYTGKLRWRLFSLRIMLWIVHLISCIFCCQGGWIFSLSTTRAIEVYKHNSSYNCVFVHWLIGKDYFIYLQLNSKSDEKKKTPGKKRTKRRRNYVVWYTQLKESIWWNMYIGELRGMITKDPFP